MSAARQIKPGWLWAVIVVAILLAIVTAWWWSANEVERALRALPEPQRRGLYQRTMENLHTVCEPAPPRSMREFCRDQAELARHFPECDDACAEIARRHRTLPTR